MIKKSTDQRDFLIYGAVHLRLHDCLHVPDSISSDYSRMVSVVAPFGNIKMPYLMS